MIKKHQDLKVYKMSYNLSMEIYLLSKKFPIEERYSLTDQIRRSSRSVCANISEAWRSRRYPNSFKHKINISECEAAETQTWLSFAKDCTYISEENFKRLHKMYDEILAQLVYFNNDYKRWCSLK